MTLPGFPFVRSIQSVNTGSFQVSPDVQVGDTLILISAGHSSVAARPGDFTELRSGSGSWTHAQSGWMASKVALGSDLGRTITASTYSYCATILIALVGSHPNLVAAHSVSTAGTSNINIPSGLGSTVGTRLLVGTQMAGSSAYNTVTVSAGWSSLHHISTNYYSARVVVEPESTEGTTSGQFNSGVGTGTWIVFGLLLSVTPPDAPTPLAPLGGASVSGNAAATLSWTYSHPDSELQAGTRIRRSIDGGPQEWWDGSNWVASEADIDAALTSFSFSIPEATSSFTWAVAVKSSGDLWSDYCADQTVSVTYDPVPNRPTSLGPATGTTIDTKETNRFSWLFSDPNPADTQAAAFDFRWRVVGESTWNVVHVASADEFFDVVPGTFPPGQIEWQVRNYDSFGGVGGWSNG